MTKTITLSKDYYMILIIPPAYFHQKYKDRLCKRYFLKDTQNFEQKINAVFVALAVP
jgi:hypothetical protein